MDVSILPIFVFCCYIIVVIYLLYKNSKGIESELFEKEYTNYDEKFEKIYSKLLEENEEELEKLRKSAKKENKNSYIVIPKLIIIAILAILAMVGAAFLPWPDTIRYTIVTGFPFFMIVYLIYAGISISNSSKHDDREQYSKEYKEKVITTIIKSFNENLNYFPDKGISSIVYARGDFDLFDRFKSEDLIEGFVNNFRITISDVFTEKQISRERNGQADYFPIFRGTIASMALPKRFDECIYLRKDIKDTSLFSAFSSTLAYSKISKIELDSQEFEKYFDVYGSNKILALQLLTSDVMQLLIEFREQTDIEYEVTMKDGTIYIRFFVGNMFEVPKYSKHALDKDYTYTYYKILNFTFSLTNKLTKIIENTEY